MFAPATVPQAKPPKPLVSSHSRLRLAARSVQTLLSKLITLCPRLKRRDLIEDLDSFTGCFELIECLRITVKAFNRMREQLIHPAGIHGLSQRHITHAGFEVFAIRVDCSHQK